MYLLIFPRIAYGPLSLSSIIWCWPKGGDAIRLEGSFAGWRKVMTGSLYRWHHLRAETGSSEAYARASTNEYGTTSAFTFTSYITGMPRPTEYSITLLRLLSIYCESSHNAPDVVLVVCILQVCIVKCIKV